MTTAGSPPRQAAFEIIRKFEKTGSTRLKADSLINDALLSATYRNWPPEDKAFLTALVYIVLRHWVWLDFVIDAQSSRDSTRIEPAAKSLLRLGIAQLALMDKIPDHAAIYNTVDIAKRKRMQETTVRFVNGMLRNVQRQLKNGGYPIPTFESDPVAHLSLTHNIPSWLVSHFIKQYGQEKTLSFLPEMNAQARLAIRLNTLKTTMEAYQQTLTAHKIAFQAPSLPETPPETLLLPLFSGSPVQLPGYHEGHVFIQDPASARVAHWLAPKPNELVFDLCAAPGGKTTHIAALMQNQGRIIAVEPAADRLPRLEENIQRLGATNITIRNEEAQTVTFAQKADRILVDAPCSGLGTARRHPEILRQIRWPDLAEYAKTQRAILEHAITLLKPGGILVYSTCSLDPSENQNLITAFAAAHPGIVVERQQQFFPTAQSDGFYIARLRTP